MVCSLVTTIISEVANAIPFVFPVTVPKCIYERGEYGPFFIASMIPTAWRGSFRQFHTRQQADAGMPQSAMRTAMKVPDKDM